jgi:predicted Fe-S protein YdhL (DUF1289 family)
LSLRSAPKTLHNNNMSQDTPCIAVCMLDPRTNLCFGCGRTLPEITRWSKMTGDDRRALMAELPQRMRAAGLPPMSGRDKRE